MSTPGNMQIVQVMGFLVAEPDQPVKDDSKDDDRTSDACHGFTSLSIKDTKWRGTGNRPRLLMYLTTTGSSISLIVCSIQWAYSAPIAISRLKLTKFGKIQATLPLIFRMPIRSTSAWRRLPANRGADSSTSSHTNINEMNNLQASLSIQISSPASATFCFHFARTRARLQIVAHSDAKVPFTIKVIDTDKVNAFALPGGFFYVNSGLILEAENESELAGVMAHEISHVTARHSTERLTKGTLLQYATIPALFIGGYWAQMGIRSGLGMGLSLSVLGITRANEREADQHTKVPAVPAAPKS